MSDDELLVTAALTMIDRGHISIEALSGRIGPAIRDLHKYAAEVTKQRDACLAACRTALEMCRKDNCGRRVVQPTLLAAIALCEQEKPDA